jgi:hypothetical protein
MCGRDTRDRPDAATYREGDAMRKRAFDPYSDPEFVRKNQRARVVIFSTVCILVSLGVLGTFVPVLLAELQLRGSSTSATTSAGGSSGAGGLSSALPNRVEECISAERADVTSSAGITRVFDHGKARGIEMPISQFCNEADAALTAAGISWPNNSPFGFEVWNGHVKLVLPQPH